MSDERISSIKTPDYGITPKLNYYGTETRVEFNGSCLKQEKITYTHGKLVNIYTVYELTSSTSEENDPTIKNSLFGAVTLTKNADNDGYGYSVYGIVFHGRGSFSFPGIGLGRNVITFGVNMGSSTKIDNKKKDILILGKGPTQDLEHTLSAQKCIQLILQWLGRNFVEACIIMEQIVIYLLMVQKLWNSTQKILRL